MQLLIIVSLAAATLILMKIRKESDSYDDTASGNGNHHSSISPVQPKIEYEVWRNLFRQEKDHVKEFELFGTQAAIGWNDDDDAVMVTCVTAFRNQAPVTKKWDLFEFNLRNLNWTGATPKGSPARIREELKEIGLI